MDIQIAHHRRLTSGKVGLEQDADRGKITSFDFARAWPLSPNREVESEFLI